jgi:hypothetical protein
LLKCNDRLTRGRFSVIILIDDLQESDIVDFSRRFVAPGERQKKEGVVAVKQQLLQLRALDRSPRLTRVDTSIFEIGEPHEQQI